MKLRSLVLPLLCSLSAAHGQPARTATNSPATACVAGCTVVPTGAISWWKGETNADDSLSTNHGTLSGNVTFLGGKVGQAFNLDGIGGRVVVANSASLNFGSNADFTIECWIKPQTNSRANYGIQSIVDKRHAPSLKQAVGFTLILVEGRLAAQITANPLNHYYNIGPAGPDLRGGQWAHVAMAVDRDNPSGGALYVNGAKVLTFDPTHEIGDLANNEALRIGNHADPGLNGFFKGQIDEVTLYNRALRSNEIQAIYNAGAAGKCLGDTCASVPSGIVGWWPMDGHPTDLGRTNNAILVGGATYASAMAGQGLSLNGNGQYAVVPRNTDLDVGANNEMTVEGWVNVQDGLTRPIFEWSDASLVGVHMWANLPSAGRIWVNLVDTSGLNHSNSVGGLSLNSFNHLVLSYDKNGARAKLHLNGTLVLDWFPGSFTPATSREFYLGYRPSQWGAGTSFKGYLDEFAVYNRVLSDTDIASVYSAGCGGKCKVDNNANGVPDLWETQWFGGTIDPNDDPDGDGLTNLQEFLFGSRPLDTMVVAWGDNSSGQCDVPAALRDVVGLAGGRDFSLALRRNGTVVAWGSNSVGQTNVTTGLSNAVSISANWYDSVALRRDGTVVHWGPSSAPPTSATNLAAVSVGYDSVLALRSNGTVMAWGQNSWRTNVPGNLSGVAAIAAGFNHSVAVLTNGAATAWGIGGSSLGWGLTNVPASATNAGAVAAGALHTLVLRKDGTVVAWGNNADGQTNVPDGLNNVKAVSAGWSSSLALQTNGTLAAWGGLAAGAPTPLPQGLSNALAIASGANHNLVLRGGRLTPLIMSDPMDQLVLPGSSPSFSVRVGSLAAPSYQWKFYGTNLTGKTNATLTLNNVRLADTGPYRVAVTNGAGWALSATGTLQLAGAPMILFPTNTVYQWFGPGAAGSLTVIIAGATNAYGLSYYWKHNGTNVGTSLPTYALMSPMVEGQYTVTVSNAVGSVTSAPWIVRTMSSGAAGAWGRNNGGQLNRPTSETNLIALVAGLAHGLGLREDGTVFAWGTNDHGQASVPANLTNVTAIAAGATHSLALKADGTVAAWGDDAGGQTSVPGDVTTVAAISAGGNQSLALKQNGTVRQWGQTFGNPPTGLINVTAIASGANFHLALSNKTVVAWGNNGAGQLNVPGTLSNVVAIAASEQHALALQADGIVRTWGSNGSGESTVPAGLSNVMAIAAGRAHSLALKNDGTVIAWGDNTYGEAAVQTGLGRIKLIAAGGDFNLASAFSPLLQYPINVSKDLLLIYNSNSVDSVTVKDYYLANRPMVSNANVLGIGSPGIFVANGTNDWNWRVVTNTWVYESVTRANFTNSVLNPISGWLSANPTKRPEYVVLLLDVPSRVNVTATNASGYAFYWAYALNSSASYQLSTAFPGWTPLITHINMGDTNACKAYIDKLRNMDSSSLLISASARNYANTNYCFDDAQASAFFNLGITGVVAAGVSPLAISYSQPGPPNSNHIFSATNLAGFGTWGVNGKWPINLGNILKPSYAVDGTEKFYGNSGWYIIETVESFDGLRYLTDQGTFVTWFANNAFGGANYSNTPVGAVTHTDEPGGAAWCEDPRILFGLWASGKNFAICAWASRRTDKFQAVGDPFVGR